jgi:uncharacterized repeat protein (TIGR01451 family)
MLLAYALIAWTSSSLLALADGPPRFEMSVVPQAEYAVVGQTFTYAVVITNVSQVAVKDVVVRVKTPAGTTLVGTYFANANWYVGGIRRSEAGEVIWLTREPVTPGEAVTFKLMVNVPPEMVGQQLINEGYVVAIGNGDPMASGPPIRTQVLAALPTPIATPLPPATATRAAPKTATPSAPTSLADSTVIGTATPVSSGVSQATVTKTAPWSTVVLMLVGLSVFATVGVGLAWFLRRR